MELLNNPSPNIVISASGMCEAGRILHHLRYKIHNPRNTIIIVGYMAENTLGRRLLEFGKKYEESGRQGPAPMLKFLNKMYPLQAHVHELGGFSAHGDKNEILRFLKESGLNIKQIALVHGEEEQILPFRDFLHSHGYNAVVPRAGEIIKISETQEAARITSRQKKQKKGKITITGLVDRIIEDGQITNEEHQQLLSAIGKDSKLDEEESKQTHRVIQMIQQGELKVVP